MIGLSRDQWHRYAWEDEYVGKVENYGIPRAVTSAAYLAALEAAK
jgi:hypothetical protein